MSKQIIFEEEVYKKFLKGVEVLAKAVTATLGPKGRYVVFDRKFGYPVVTNDGVTIAKEVSLEDPFENIGAQLVKQISIKTNEVAGDGTTTAVALAWGLVKEGFKNVFAGVNPTLMKVGMEKALEVVVAELKKQARVIDLNNVEQARKDLTHIATISSSEPNIGALIAEAVLKVGKDGVVTVEEGSTADTVLEIVDGMQFDRGFIHPYFVTNPARMEAVFENPYFLFINQKVNQITEDLVNLLQKVFESGQPLVVVPHDLETEVTALFIENKVKGTLRCAVVKSPGFGDARFELLEDLAVLTGGKVFSPDTNLTFKQGTLAHLGRASKVIVTRDTTTIIGGKGDSKAIEDRVAQLRRLSNESTSDFEKAKIAERIAKLTGGVAVISVGGSTESEVKARKYKVEDALNAAKAAVAEGIVAGGGVALLKIKLGCKADNSDEQLGISMVAKVLEYPFLKIVENAGKDGHVLMERLRNSSDAAYGYDALHDTFGNMFNLGIIDPVKVTRSAITNAISVVGLMLTTNVLITDLEKDKDDSSIRKKPAN